jgi:hypothetical protein
MDTTRVSGIPVMHPSIHPLPSTCLLAGWLACLLALLVSSTLPLQPSPMCRHVCTNDMATHSSDTHDIDVGTTTHPASIHPLPFLSLHASLPCLAPGCGERSITSRNTHATRVCGTVALRTWHACMHSFPSADLSSPTPPADPSPPGEITRASVTTTTTTTTTTITDRSDQRRRR